jgi:hypothetical protein
VVDCLLVVDDGSTDRTAEVAKAGGADIEHISNFQNYGFLPELMAKRIFGFTLSWLILGILFFPLVWIIAWVFIRRSIALEKAEIKSVRGKQ